MFAITPTLTAHDVAERENIPLHRVWYLISVGRIFPIQQYGRSWLIADPYVILPRGRGRPVGTGGRYPKNVKRPRKDPDQIASK